MGWKKLVHECDASQQIDPAKDGAEPGSIWTCPVEGCGQESELVPDPVEGMKWKKREVVRPVPIPKNDKPNKDRV